MTAFNLVYYAASGRAESIRLAFAVAKIPFTNTAIPFSEFAEVKPTLPIGAVPILEIEEEGTEKKVLPQADAILRYIGRQGDLYPSDPMEAFEVDVMLDTLTDLQKPLDITNMGAKSSLIMDREFELEEKMAMRQRIVESAFPKFLGFVEGCLVRSRSGWLVGDKLTVADLKLFSIACIRIQAGSYDGIGPEHLVPYPHICAHIEKVKSVPEIAHWYRTIPKPYGTFDFAPN